MIKTHDTKQFAGIIFVTPILFSPAETGEIVFDSLLSQLTFNLWNNPLAESESVWKPM